MAENFLEDSYISKLKDKNYKEVDSITLPDGIYHKYDGGYQFSIHSGLEEATFGPPPNPKYDTGFVVVTNDGIRGFWGGQEIEIKDGQPVGENVYKIMTNRLDIIREEKLEKLL